MAYTHNCPPFCAKCSGTHGNARTQPVTHVRAWNMNTVNVREQQMDMEIRSDTIILQFFSSGQHSFCSDTTRWLLTPELGA